MTQNKDLERLLDLTVRDNDIEMHEPLSDEEKQELEQLKDTLQKALEFQKEFPEGSLGMMRAFNWLDKNAINQIPKLAQQLQQAQAKLKKIDELVDEFPIPEEDIRLGKIQAILKDSNP